MIEKEFVLFLTPDTGFDIRFEVLFGVFKTILVREMIQNDVLYNNFGSKFVVLDLGKAFAFRIEFLDVVSFEKTISLINNICLDWGGFDTIELYEANIKIQKMNLVKSLEQLEYKLRWIHTQTKIYKTEIDPERILKEINELDFFSFGGFCKKTISGVEIDIV